jgi:hypothetical protein
MVVSQVLLLSAEFLHADGLCTPMAFARHAFDGLARFMTNADRRPSLTSSKAPVELWGVDFTCAPTRRKAITVARGRWTDATTPNTQGVVSVTALSSLPTLADFEALLQTAGPWLAAFDFPFGLPRAFVQANGLGAHVDAVIAQVHARCHNRMAMRAWIDAWGATQPPGQRLLHRATDRTSWGVSSTSPLQTRYVPVAWMYFEGVRRLVQANVSMPGLRVGRSDAIALEGYPGLLAHALIGKRSYKNTDDADRRDARRDILRQLQRGSGRLQVSVKLTPKVRAELVADPSGDLLDAVLCLAQAAWASRQPNFGLPRGVDPVEGWIATS